jgi:hypothetical protein
MTDPVDTSPRYPNPDPWDGDPAYLVDTARGILRMSSTDAEVASRLTPLSYAITDLVRQHLAWALPFDAVDQTAPIPDPITQSCVNALVEAYRRKDAPYGITGAWSPDGVAIRVTRDWLDGVLYQLQPYRQGWGVA